MKKLETILGIAFAAFVLFSAIGMLVFAPLWAGITEIVLLIAVFSLFLIGVTHDTDEIPTNCPND